MPHLAVALDSVLSQSYSLDNIEVIVVDDGSTDDTLATAERYRSQHPGLFSVIALPEASGSPAKPRNVALERAKGKYIFFLDADDWLAQYAVELMLGHAEEWNSDVLLVRLAGEGGRDVPQSMFFANQPSVDVFESNVMWTFGPMKLFKRDLLIRNQIQFPDYMPEDIIFTLKSYLLAKTVSVASDYDYYHYLQYDTDRQCSFSTWENLESNYRALLDVFNLMSTSLFRGRDPIILLRRMFQRDICNMLSSACRQHNESMFDKICRLVRPYYSDRVASSMALPQRIILDCSFNEGFQTVRKVVSGLKGMLESDNFNYADGFLVFCLKDNPCLSEVSLNETGGFRALVGVVKSHEADHSIMIEGVVFFPSWIPQDIYCLSLLIQEVRGYPSIILDCNVNKVEDGCTMSQESDCRKWDCLLNEDHLAKTPRFCFPLRRRDFFLEKKWHLYLILKTNKGLIKRIRITTEWNFEASVQKPFHDLTSNWRNLNRVYQTQWGGFSLTTKYARFLPCLRER